MFTSAYYYVEEEQLSFNMWLTTIIADIFIKCTNNKVRCSESRQRAYVSPIMYSDVLGCIRHMLDKLLVRLWHRLSLYL